MSYSLRLKHVRVLEIGLVWLGMVGSLLFGSWSGLGTSVAAAQAPETLWTRCDGPPPADDVPCGIPSGIGADPQSGHVFVADRFNRRVVEFTARGQFVKTWGWDVVEGGGTGFEVCVPADGDICKAGVEGAGDGQFGGSGPQGIAPDSAGNVYVVDFANHRVEKFDPQGNFLLMFGGQVNKTKVDEAAAQAAQNICTAASGDVCQAGIEGAGDGQFGWLTETYAGSFIAIDVNDTASDADDVVYVGDRNRIQRFDTDGAYQALDIAIPGETVQSLALDAVGTLYATYVNKFEVRKITSAGEELASPRFKLVTSNGKDAVPTAVAVDSLGHVYAFGPARCNGCGSEVLFDPIFEFDPAGSLVANFGIGEFTGSPIGLATNHCSGGEAPGNLYASNPSLEKPFVRAFGPEPSTCGRAITGEPSNVTETSARLNGRANPSGEAVTECLFEYGTGPTFGNTVPCEESSGEIGTGTEPVPVHANIGGLTKGTVYHVRLVVGGAAGGEAGSDEPFKTLGPPVITHEAASNVTYSEATLKALVNSEGFPAKYHFEYGLDTTYGSSTTTIEVGSPGDRSQHPAVVNLKDLQPGTAYNWRIVTTNSSGTTASPNHVFTTFLRPEHGSCSKDLVRIGAAASLPDCRGYELVSPVNKNGGDVIPGYVQIAAGDDRIAYSAAPAFGEVQASVSENHYLAERDPGDGWVNRGIHPPANPQGVPVAGFFGLQIPEFLAFSPDLCNGWFLDVMTPPLTPDGQAGYYNIYRVGLCSPSDPPEALTDVPPLPSGTSPTYVNFGTESVAGYSADASHAVFVAQAALTPEAAKAATAQVYDRFDGSLHLVSILPTGVAASSAFVGSTATYNLENAVSEDGSRVYWGAEVTSASGLAERIFLREHPEQGKVEGECSEPAKACTVLAAGGGALVPRVFFWLAATDGSAVLYSELAEGGDKLYIQGFEQAETKNLPETKLSRRLVASHVKGVMGASDDLTRIYFVSTDALTPGEVNGNGEEAQAGEPNLYLDEGGTKTFVAALADGDVGKNVSPEEGSAYDLVSGIPSARASRASPDGAHVVFQSRARLTDFDNTDPDSGKPLVEVYRYEAGGAVLCVSCNPSGARPSGREMVSVGIRTNVFASAWIPGGVRFPPFFPRVQSDDGGRLFFNSYEVLVPADTNGAMDVYEWEAPGVGSCSEKSHAFHAVNGGCLYLISSGKSAFESRFWNTSADGGDVFFSTESSLLPKDPGLVDLYDARVEGGFPEPIRREPCEGEACQSPPLPPQDPDPASAVYRGSGNLKGPGRCPKGKRKVHRNGKARCVKPRSGKSKRRRASSNRRTAR